MSPFSQRLLALYLGALIALAALGAHNQRRIVYQEALLREQRELSSQLITLRTEAAGVTGTLAVQSWALAQGMVAAPEALNIADIAPQTAPRLASPSRVQTSVEVQTLWH